MVVGYSTGARFRVIREAVRGCNRGATALSEFSHPQGYKTDKRPKAPFS